MGLLQSKLRYFESLYEYDEVTEQVCKRDYYNVVQYVAFYASCKKPLHIFFTLFQLFVSLCILGYQTVIFGYTAFVLTKLNFTMAIFEMLLCTLAGITFCVLLHMHFCRSHFRILHKEMMLKFFEYEQPNDEIVAGLYEGMRLDKMKLLIFPVCCAFAGVNVMFISPYLDKHYGDIGFNASQYSIDFRFPVPMIVPFPEDNEMLFYVSGFFLGGSAVIVSSTYTVACLMFSNLVLYLSSQMKYLIINIRNIQARAEVLYEQRYGKIKQSHSKNHLRQDKKFLLCYDFCFMKCVQHHQLIIRWVSSTQEIAGVSVGFIYIFGSITIALSLLSVKTGTSLPGTLLMSVVFTLLEIGLCILASYYGQRIIDMSDEFGVTLYNTRWYNMNTRTNLQLRITRVVCQRTLLISGFGLAVANLDTFANVMNTAYSYYNILMAL